MNRKDRDRGVEMMYATSGMASVSENRSGKIQAVLLGKTECQPPPTSKTSGIERVQALADIAHSRYVVIATKPVHRFQSRPIVHNWEALPTIPQVVYGSVQ